MGTTGNEIKIEIGLHGDKEVVKGFGLIGDKGDQAGRRLDRSFKGAGSSIGDFNRMIVGSAGLLAAITAAGYAMNRVIGIADGWTLVEGRLNLVTDSAEQLARVQRDLFELSQDSRIEFKATADLYARLARSTTQLAVSDKDLLQVTGAINKSMIVSGATAKEAEAAIIQLSQGLASGALRGDELRSVLEQTPRLAQAIAEGMGVSIGQLRELGKEGRLTTQAVFEALMDQSSKLSAEFSKMPMTVGQSITKINNSLGRMISGVDKSVSATQALAGGISKLSGEVDNYSGSVNGLINITKNGFDLFGIGAGEAGLIGALLFGKQTKAAGVVATVSILNSQLKYFNSDIGSSIDSYNKFSESVFNLLDVVSGKRDWNTGIEIPLEKRLDDAISTYGEKSAYALRLKKEMQDKELSRPDALDSFYTAPGYEITTAKLNAAAQAQAVIDQGLLQERLNQYEKYYKELGLKVKEHARLEKQTIQDLNALYLQKINLRRSTEGLLSGLGEKTGRSREKEYSLSRSELDQQYQSALTLGGQDQIDALEKYKQAVNSLAQEFKDGFSGQQWDTSGRKITTQAIDDIKRAWGVQKEVMAELTTASQNQIEINRTWGSELLSESEKAKLGIEELKFTIAELNGQMQLFDQVLKIDAENLASPVIYSIREELDRLHEAASKPITITTIHKSVDAGSSSAEPLGSYAIGTQWVPKTGLYKLHQGETVTPASANRSGRSGGGISLGELHIHIPENSAPQKPEDWRLITRDYIMPEIREQIKS